jgi:CRP-like cAMP-binding protein
VAASDIELLWMSEKQFSHICNQNPGVAIYFLRMTTERLLSIRRGSALPAMENHTEGMPALRDGSISSVPGALIPKLAIHCRDL